MSDERRLADKAWHLDKRIPLAMILAIIGQAVVFIWLGSSFAARTELRLTVLERSVELSATTSDRLARIEESQKWVAQAVIEMKDELKAITRR